MLRLIIGASEQVEEMTYNDFCRIGMLHTSKKKRNELLFGSWMKYFLVMTVVWILW